ncbi:hypothetical protein C8J57DRAFT_1591700 [Mycena rebaudengoi]|nr:hypothetical protein C8J57DRAFT_1591700 [Mycena rebaudengoi]
MSSLRKARVSTNVRPRRLRVGAKQLASAVDVASNGHAQAAHLGDDAHERTPQEQQHAPSRGAQPRARRMALGGRMRKELGEGKCSTPRIDGHANELKRSHPTLPGHPTTSSALHKESPSNPGLKEERSAPKSRARGMKKSLACRRHVRVVYCLLRVELHLSRDELARQSNTEAGNRMYSRRGRGEEPRAGGKKRGSPHSPSLHCGTEACHVHHTSQMNPAGVDAMPIAIDDDVVAQEVT